MTLPEQLPGIRTVAERYQGIILDLWGVVHDGQTAFPHSAATFERLKAAGIKVVLLTNAPRRSHTLASQLQGLGIDRSLYDDIVSSGEAVHTSLVGGSDLGFADLGRRCHHMGPDRDISVFEGLGLDFTGPEDADFIVNTGPADFNETLADYIPALETGARRGIPMICANPDRWIVRQGRKIMCAGVFADHYLELGGNVFWRGKPDPAVYTLCLDRLGVPPEAVAVVGDGLETDVRGAANAGLDCVWVTGGLHAEELAAGYGIPADPARAAALAATEGLAPKSIVAGFIW